MAGSLAIMMSGRNQTAYHEVGHAVAGSALGVSVEVVSIRRTPSPMGGSTGHVVFGRHATEDLALIKHNGAVHALAGPIAEAMAQAMRARRNFEDEDLLHVLRFGRAEWMLSRDSNDYHLAAGCVPAGLSASKGEEWLIERAREAHLLLVAHWPVVETARRLLMSRKTGGVISGSDIEAMMTTAGGEPE